MEGSTAISSHLARITRRIFLLLLATIALLVATAVPLAAQYKLCYPSTTWYGSASGPNLASLKVDDPGWFGAFRYVFGDGTTSQYAVVQGIRDGSNNLFLSFEAEGLTSLDPTTVVVIGLDYRKLTTDTGPLWEIVLRPVTNPPPATTPADPGSVVGVASGTRTLYSGTANTTTGVATWTQLTTPAWLLSPNNPVGYWHTGTTYNWFLETEIPAANLPAPTSGTFGLYVNIFRVVSGKYQESWWPPVANLSEPGCPPGSILGSCNPGTKIPNPGVLMAAYNWGGSTIDPAQSCSGVSLSSQNNDIFTNNTPNSTICAHPGPNASCTATPNIFTANVHNTMVNGVGTAQPAANVEATFYIANFGLNGPWDSSQWTKISPLTSNPTTPVTLGVSSTTPLSTTSWSVPNPNDYDPTVAGSHPHQCIMVKLDSTTGNVDFINNTAIQNMDIVHASSFQRDAEINAKGYPPRPDNADGTHNTDQLFEIHVTTRQEVLTGGQAQAVTGVRTGQGAPTKGDQVVSQLTWIAKGCRHTGRYMMVDERKIEVCEPLSGFGYVVRHTGKTAVRKWNVRFTGAGLVPVKGEDNTYEIHVPQDGVAKVTTFAEPKESNATTGKFAVFLDVGGNFPHGDFGTVFDPGFSLNAGLEYIAASHFSVEGIFGYHHFSGIITPDLDLYQFSVNGKAYLATGTIRPFINGGVGGYDFSPGPTKFGGNIGGGVSYNLTPHFGFQGSYNFHVINTPDEATKFSTFQGGIRFVF